jgi:hypothetical protein
MSQTLGYDGAVSDGEHSWTQRFHSPREFLDCSIVAGVERNGFRSCDPFQTKRTRDFV